MFNIIEEYNKKGDEIVKRLSEKSSLNTKDIKELTPEEIGKELSKLYTKKDELMKIDPEDEEILEIEKKIEKLTNEMKKFDCECKKINESRLPSNPDVDPDFGVPEEKKYPLFDKEHVEAAIRLFGHVKPRFEEKLAKAIIVKMKKFGIPFEIVGQDNKLYKYIPEAFKSDESLKESAIKVNESVLDPIRKEKCDDIFDGKVMKKSVKDFIINNFEKWKKEIDVNFTVDKYYLIGSSASYQYTDVSDVDITVVSKDFNEEEHKNIIRILPNGNNLPGTNRPVNYFIKNSMEDRLAENIYDITDDKWLKETEKSDVKIPQTYVLELAKFFMNAVDLSLNEFNRDKIEYLEFKNLDPDKVEISEEERADVLNKKLFELKADLDSIRIGNHVIRGFVHEAYDNEENYFNISIEIVNKNRSPQMSVNNLVYKCLEKYGYREKIDKFLTEAKNFIESEENK